MATIMEEIPYDNKKTAKASPADSLSEEKKSLPDVEKVRAVSSDEELDSLATKGTLYLNHRLYISLIANFLRRGRR